MNYNLWLTYTIPNTLSALNFVVHFGYCSLLLFEAQNRIVKVFPITQNEYVTIE